LGEVGLSKSVFTMVALDFITIWKKKISNQNNYIYYKILYCSTIFFLFKALFKKIGLVKYILVFFSYIDYKILKIDKFTLLQYLILKQFHTENSRNSPPNDYKSHLTYFLWFHRVWKFKCVRKMRTHSFPSKMKFSSSAYFARLWSVRKMRKLRKWKM
jgi:hypothetical protein